MSEGAADEVLDLIYGHWRSRILYAGVELGVFDHVARSGSKQAEAVAAEIGVDQTLLYRLMRAPSAIGLLIEDESRGFATSETGELLRSGHPDSLRSRVLIAEGPEQYAIWKHLPDIIKDGKQDGFIREFGVRAFDYARTNPDYRRTFDQGMTAHSVIQSNLVLEALRDCEFSSIQSICASAEATGTWSALF
jgi:Dimerisation domain/O-methyltransferase domain